jgi:hypothetical protein
MTMPKYIIERDIPNAGALSARELQGISQKSCGVLSVAPCKRMKYSSLK